MSERKRGREEGEQEGAAVGQDGKELSLSIEETNKLRISLGLKPLVLGAPKADDEARKRVDDQRKQQEKDARAQAFIAKQAEKKTRAQQESFLDVKGLGEDDSVDDIQTWAERQRVEAAARRAEEAAAIRTKAHAQAARQRQAAGDSEEEEEGGAGAKGGYTAADLAGMKVRHDASELGEGETVVLTLADRVLLEQRGQAMHEDADEDMLENVLKAEDRKRSKAREAAAPKAKPLWEEDGKQRGLLDKWPTYPTPGAAGPVLLLHLTSLHPLPPPLGLPPPPCPTLSMTRYNEEEADIVVQLGADGSLESERLKQQEEVRRKLVEAGRVLDSAAVGVLAPGAAAPRATAPASASEYYTAAEAEAAAGGKVKKKKERKERRIRAKSPAAGEEDGSSAALIEQLEAEAELAAAAGTGPGAGSELGSRAARSSQRAAAEVAQRQAVEDKRARFEAAVAKGNWASLALKAQPNLVVGEEDEDADRELRESLARARRLAAAQGVALGGAAAAAQGAAVQLTLDPRCLKVRGVAAVPCYGVGRARQVAIERWQLEDFLFPGQSGKQELKRTVPLGARPPSSTLEAIAASAAAKREEDEARLKQELAGGAVGGPGQEGREPSGAGGAAALAAVKKEQLLVNDTMEFVRNIQVKQLPMAPLPVPGMASVAAGSASSRLPPPPSRPGAARGAPGKAEADDGYMGLGGAEAEAEARPARPVAPKGWVSASLDGEAAGGSGPEGMEVDPAGPQGEEEVAAAAAAPGSKRGARKLRATRHTNGDAGSGQEEGGGDKDDDAAEGDDDDDDEEEAAGQLGLGERSMRRGLAGTLAVLKEKGDLDTAKHITWAGRVNDRSKNALLGVVGDVYTGGAHEDRLARSIEAALTTKDEFGRVMTPKERFRQLNYDFHGKRPSLNKEANRLKKAGEEIARRKNATSEVAEQGEVMGLLKVTEKVQQPYVVLQGKGAMETLKSAGMLPPAAHGKTAAGKAGHKGKAGGGRHAGPLGSLTPLLGDKKVEAMLGVKKPHKH
ncbi:hypothetical protein QJQ45_021854 [Haematococcus lacustris]|nr:hypothetical protein QJQ45_021854 [Haematococcus lacustris]